MLIGLDNGIDSHSVSYGLNKKEKNMKYLQSMASLNSILLAVSLIGFLLSYEDGTSLIMNVFLGGFIYSSINLLCALCMAVVGEGE